MKFKGAGIVWDAQNNKSLIEFKNGVAETTDQRTIDILTKNGFQELNEVQNLETLTDENSDVEAEETIELNWNDIKRKASSLGISIKGKNKETLLAEINGR